MAEPSEGRKWQRLIRAAVREACETWCIQAQAGPVTERQLEAIINRAAVPILRSMQEHPPELVTELLPSLVRVILAAAVEVMAEERRAIEYYQSKDARRRCGIDCARLPSTTTSTATRRRPVVRLMPF